MAFAGGLEEGQHHHVSFGSVNEDGETRSVEMSTAEEHDSIADGEKGACSSGDCVPKRRRLWRKTRDDGLDFGSRTGVKRAESQGGSAPPGKGVRIGSADSFGDVLVYPAGEVRVRGSCQGDSFSREGPITRSSGYDDGLLWPG